MLTRGLKQKEAGKLQKIQPRSSYKVPSTSMIPQDHLYIKILSQTGAYP